MKSMLKFLLVLFAVAPGAYAAPVAQTAGSNLTQYNGAAGSVAGNQWNAMTNPRINSQSNPTAKADYNNCESVILRCAKPKCAGGGCSDMDVARTIAMGCVNSNTVCKKQGESLITSVAGQLVSDSVAKKNKQDAETAAAQAAAQAAAEQNSAAMQQQMQMMQQQMQSMQEQNNAQIASLQNALVESQRATADAVATAAQNAAANVISNSSTVVDAGTGLTEVQAQAAKSGVSDDVITRHTITGQILTDMEGVDTALDNLKTTMRDAFRYGNCNEVTGDNCTGPRRAAKFRELAKKFFEPYEELENNLASALTKAQSVGVDLGNIYAFFSGSCNSWAQYVCRGDYRGGLPQYRTSAIACDLQSFQYPAWTSSGNNSKDIDLDSTVRSALALEITAPNTSGTSQRSAPNTVVVYKAGQSGMCGPANCVNGKSLHGGANGAETRGGHDCYNGQVIPPEDLLACSINKSLDPSKEDIPEMVLNPDSSSTGSIRVGCGSDNMLNGITRRRRSSTKSNSGIDIDLLEYLLNQTDNGAKLDNARNYCGIGTGKAATANDLIDEAVIQNLRAATVSKVLKIDKGSCCEVAGKDCTKDCYNLDIDVSAVAPIFALCDTHIYNINKDRNLDSSSTTAEREQLNEVIGLKTTIIAQQLYKQYKTMEVLVKQLKILLEKEVLMASVRVAGGTSNDDEDSGNDKVEFENCAKGEDSAVLTCLRSNLAKYSPFVTKGRIKNNVIKAMKEDASVANLYLDSNNANSDKFKKNECEDMNKNKDGMQKCFEALQTAVRLLDIQVRSDNKKYSVSSGGFKLVPAE